MSNDTSSNESDHGMNSVPDQLVQCSLCLRRMRQEVFLKHPNLCSKNPSNKRNVQVFDMKKYRSVQSGDKIIPVSKISSNRTIVRRPSQTRSAKRDRRSDSIVQPIIENFCTYKLISLSFSLIFSSIQVVQLVNVHSARKPMIVMLHFAQVKSNKFNNLHPNKFFSVD